MRKIVICDRIMSILKAILPTGIPNKHKEDVLMIKIGKVGKNYTVSVKESSNRNSDKGFTLVELIVVLVVIAVLAAISVPALLGFIDHSKKKSYKLDAEAALKASQTALTEVYNDSGNILSEARRYKAWKTSGVDGVDSDDSYDASGKYSKFKMWTVNKLVAGSGAGSTTATIDKISSYTVAYALYTVPKSEGDYVVFYNGSEWEVYDDMDALNEELDKADSAYSKLNAGYSDNVIYMWPVMSDSATGIYNINTADWEQRDDDDEFIEKKVTLHGFKRFEKGVSFATGESSFDDITVVVRMDNKNNVTVPWTISEGSISFIDESEKTYTLNIDDPFEFTGNWFINDTKNKITLESTDLVTRIFAAENPVTELTAAAYLPYEERTITFKAFNPNTLWFGDKSANIAERKITFRKYLGDFDETISLTGNDDIVDEDGNPKPACEWTDYENDVNYLDKDIEEGEEPEYGYEFLGWALSQGSKSGYEQSGNELKSYNSIQELWSRVFWSDADKDNPVDHDTAESYVFTGIMKCTKDVKLLSGEHASFKKNSATELDITVSLLELTGKLTDEFDLYKNNEIVPASGYRHSGWKLTKINDVAVTESKSNKFVDRGITPIKAYVQQFIRQITTPGCVLEFTAIIDPGSRTRFIEWGNSNLKNNCFAGQIACMNSSVNEGTRDNHFVEFSRVNYDDALLLFNKGGASSIFSVYKSKTGSDLIKDYEDSDKEKHKCEKCSGHCKTQIMNIPFSNGSLSGTLVKVFILWDGDDQVYNVPAYGFNVKDSSGNYHGFWFSREEHPELKGNFKHLFMGMTNVNLSNAHLGDWNTSTCTNMSSMFEKSNFHTADLDLNDWDFGSVETMQNMFWLCPEVKSVNITGKTMNSLTNANTVFKECQNLTKVNITGCVMNGKPTNMYQMFINCTSLSEVSFIDCNMNTVVSMKEMYNNCTNLSSISITGCNFNNLNNIQQEFNNCTNLASVSIDDCSINSLGSMASLFNGRTNLTSVSISGCDLSSVTTMQGIFNNCTNLTNVSFDGSSINSLESMSQMFKARTHLTSVSFDGCDLSSVTSMQEMFSGATALTSLSFEGATTESLTTLYLMCKDCRSLETLDVSMLDTSNVTTTQSMFENCYALETLTVRNNGETKFLFDDELTNVSNMFKNCYNLESFDATIYGDCSSLTNISYWFNRCYKIHFLDFTYFTPGTLNNEAEAFSYIGLENTEGNASVGDGLGVAIFANEPWNCSNATASINFWWSYLYGTPSYNDGGTNDSNMVTRPSEGFVKNSTQHFQPVHKEDLDKYVYQKNSNMQGKVVTCISGGFFNYIDDDPDFYNEMKEQYGP